jgi:hypothetical protein
MYTFGVFDQQHPEMIESHAELHHAEIQNFSAWCSGRREGFASDLSHWKLAIACGLIITPSATAFGIFNDLWF